MAFSLGSPEVAAQRELYLKVEEAINSLSEGQLEQLLLELRTYRSNRIDTGFFRSSNSQNPVNGIIDLVRDDEVLMGSAIAYVEAKLGKDDSETGVDN